MYITFFCAIDDLWNDVYTLLGLKFRTTLTWDSIAQLIYMRSRNPSGSIQVTIFKSVAQKSLQFAVRYVLAWNFSIFYKNNHELPVSFPQNPEFYVTAVT